MRHPTSMRRSTTRRQVTRSSRASSRASDGFTTIGQERLSSARSFRALNPIRRISRCRGRLGPCLQTGKHGSTTRQQLEPLAEHRRPTDRFCPYSMARHAGVLECMLFAGAAGIVGKALAKPIMLDLESGRWVSLRSTHPTGAVINDEVRAQNTPSSLSRSGPARRRAPVRP